MKKIVSLMNLLVCLVIFTFFIGCSESNLSISSPSEKESINEISRATTWHSLTQSQRNQRIVSEATSWTTGVYGNTCKEWVRTVVKNASWNDVNIPSNSGNCAWSSHAYVEERNVDISSAWSGDLIQMQLVSTSGPHTAVIINKTLTGLTIRESNWNLDKKVNSSRWLSYDDFDDMVSCYSIYYIE